MVRIPKGLIAETKAICRLYQFLRYECGLKVADNLTAKELRQLLSAFNKKD